MNFIAKTFDQLTVRELYEIVRSRQEIFIIEQQILCREIDDIDPISLHCFIEESGKVVAYLRAFVDGDGGLHIGRVLSLRHGVGLGRRLMELALPEVYRAFGRNLITIHAQTYAEGFYEKFGFVKSSDIFLEDGLEHISMELKP